MLNSSTHATPVVLLLSLLKERHLDDVNSHLTSALRSCSTVHTVEDRQTLSSYIASQTPPKAVVCIDGAPSEPKFQPVLASLIKYTRRGGIVVFAGNFSNGVDTETAMLFFLQWDLSWDVGSYLRTAVHLNKTSGAVPGMDLSGLPSHFSIKSLMLTDVPPKHAIYNPSASSRIESQVFHSNFFPIDPSETPVAYAPVGSGYFGYVGDVNAQVETTSIILAMCHLPLSAAGPDRRTCSASIRLNPADPNAGASGEANLYSDAIRQGRWKRHVGAKIGDVLFIDNKMVSVPDATEPSSARGPSASKARSSKTETTSNRPRRPREDEVEARRKKRMEVAQVKHKEGDEWKDKGNTAFRKGDWEGTTDYYIKAIKTNGPRPVYQSNLAQVYLNQGWHEEAISAASKALAHDPKHLKARYRRALAREAKGLFTDALADLEICVQMSPDSQEVHTAIQRLRIRSSIQGAVNTGAGDASPGLDQPPLYLEEESDSSDYEHDGNGIPCGAYNHDGCRNGKRCEFKHSPGRATTRDELGRNICNMWRAGICAFGDHCPYLHSAEYLPQENNSQSYLDNSIRITLVEDVRTREWPFIDPAMIEKGMKHGLSYEHAHEAICQFKMVPDDVTWERIALVEASRPNPKEY